MKIEFKGNYCTVWKEEGDPYMQNESHLLFHLKRNLQEAGHDVIKKRMWKDGHLVDELQQYIRTRNKKSPRPHLWIWDHRAIRNSARDFNHEGVATFTVDYNIFDQEDTNEETPRVAEVG